MPDQKRQHQTNRVDDIPLILPLTAVNASMLSLVGGKAANLGELIHAGLSVPPGFCITTAAYSLMSEEARLDSILAELARTSAEKTERTNSLAAAVRAALLQVDIPMSVARAISEAYHDFGNGDSLPVAVRSSATAEDLPSASFAGQQETFLNVVGIEPVLTAVRRCFASLWTERAVSYRASLGIDPRTVRLAVVIQRLVDAQVAGVLFSANPLTGKRRESVIEANPGLGEAVVSGATRPDHFVVNSTTGEIVQRRSGDKRIVIRAAVGGGTEAIAQTEPRDAACLSDTQVCALSALGKRIEAHFGSPQDIEWAIDASDQLFLLQARPITTLFPLPVGAPSTDEVLRVYLSFGIQQGTYRPFTSMGLSILRLISSGFSTFVGYPQMSPLSGPSFVTEAACRLFFDVTGALRTSFGRAFLIQAMEEAEIQAAASFQRIVADPRLSLVKTPRRAFVRAFALLLIRSHMPWYLLQAVVAPGSANARILRLVNKLREASKREEYADTATRLAVITRLLFESPRLLFQVSPVMLAGMQTYALAKRLLGDLASVSECQAVLGGSPSNPTTQMNLALWALSKQVHVDPEAAQLVQNTPAAQLARDYHAESLPLSLQQGLARFLREYGHLGIAELDVGAPRWSEEPGDVLESLASYRQIHDSTQAPDAQFQLAERAARTMVATLSHRAKQRHWLRGSLVGFCLRRAHMLAGYREMPRFVVALLLARVRTLLVSIGADLRQAGKLAQAEDIFFLTLSEVQMALAGTDLRTQVNARRVTYEEERTRRHVPLVLLSDGTEPTARPQSITLTSNTLQGTPASQGNVTGKARVILDPHGAQLFPGEILVAPTTDPAWTPLFLTAAGLVMEMGGSMAHGAIVAREYGLPAVVGVAGATERISSGMRITVDGAAGTVIIDE